MLLILDKDGTLTKPASGQKFIQTPQDQQVLPGVEEALGHYQSQGCVCVIASNQGGVAAGHKTIDEAIAEMRYCLELLPQIDRAYFCPDFEGEQCWVVDRQTAQQLDIGPLKGRMRKPQDGMIQQAILDDPDETEVLFVGDRPEDETAAILTEVKFQWADEWRRLPKSMGKLANLHLPHWISEEDDSWIDAQNDPAFDPAEVNPLSARISLNPAQGEYSLPESGMGWSRVEGPEITMEYLQQYCENSKHLKFGPFLKSEDEDEETFDWVPVECSDGFLLFGIKKASEAEREAYYSQPLRQRRSTTFKHYHQTFQHVPFSNCNPQT